MANMTAREQLMLELTNRARMDPKGEALRLNVTLASGQDTPVAVLAGNDALRKAAFNHSGWMLINDEFSSTQASSSQSYIAASPLDRMKGYGYAVTGQYNWGENISWKGNTASLDFTASIAAQHEGLFQSATSRARLLSADFQEMGIGQQAGAFVDAGKTYVTSMITQDFIKAGAKVFVTGVIYNDTTVANDFYDVGEGTASRAVTAVGGAADTAGTGGGYELQFAASGIKTMTFDLADADLKLDVAVGSTNVKVDAVNGREIWTNGSVQSQSAAIKELHALGLSDVTLVGSNTSELVVGNAGKNQLLGLDGNDRILGNNGNDTIDGGKGNDTITGGAGKDQLTGGAGADVFVYTKAAQSAGAAVDTVTDFGDSGADRIDLRAIFGDEVVIYKDEAAITGAYQFNVTKSGADVLVHINLDADLTDEMTIVLKGTSLASMTYEDFIL